MVPIMLACRPIASHVSVVFFSVQSSLNIFPNIFQNAQVMCIFEIPVFKYISKLWTDRGYSLVTVLGLSELDAELEKLGGCKQDHRGFPG